MMKGINQQIIEVVDTGNRYIRKAILFVNPEKAKYDSDFLIHQAKKYLSQTEKDRTPRVKLPSKKRRIGWAIGNLLAGAAAGAGIAWLILG